MTDYKEYLIEFRYKDEYSKWEWRKQSCTVFADSKEHAIKKCVNMYGLGLDCKYDILSVEVYKG